MSKNTNNAAGGFDPVTLAVLNKRFEAVTIKMANTLLRTGRSGVLNLARDFSTSVVTRDCELLTGAESLPIHHLSGADLMARAMVQMHPELHRGDAFLHNSPYHGCSHPADHTILVPVIDAAGVHQFTVWVKAHQADCGNSIQLTSWSPNTFITAAATPTNYAGDTGVVIDCNVVGCPWDCDGSNDGAVNVGDLLALLGQYDSMSPNNCTGGSCDYNGDGCVDVSDLLKLLAHYDPVGVGCP